MSSNKTVLSWFLSVVTDTATGKQQSLWTSPPTPGSSGQRKRKIQLLPSRRGDQLTLVGLVHPSQLLVSGSQGRFLQLLGVGLTCLCSLGQPPPPELGYSITAEDLDMERKASLQWFNKVLEDKPGKAGAQRAPHRLSVLVSVFLGRKVVEYLIFHLVLSLIIQDCLQSHNPPASASKVQGSRWVPLQPALGFLFSLIPPGVLLPGTVTNTFPWDMEVLLFVK